MTMAQTPSRSAIRVCPYYRLPQLAHRELTQGGCPRPTCAAVAIPQSLAPEEVASLCRSGAFQTCHRYQRARARGRPPVAGPPEPSLSRKLLTSALWVIGIPTAITLAILIAAWITEKLWVATEQLIIQVAGVPWS